MLNANDYFAFYIFVGKCVIDKVLKLSVQVYSVDMSVTEVTALYSKKGQFDLLLD